MKKLKSARGETIVETLVSVLIITLIFLCLSTAIVSAARVNASVRKTDTAFAYSKGTVQGTRTVTVTKQGEAGAVETFAVTEYTTENGYRYYEKQGENP